MTEKADFWKLNLLLKYISFLEENLNFLEKVDSLKYLQLGFNSG